ncbi:MAG: hypothetical protein EA397_14190 [Deltaproteobacteria bacterium]|nr:MAG: hypothetical protein EA397_14190 [Deltaproteobacteria bacterium]
MKRALPILLVLGGCAKSIVPEFQAARDAALSPALQVPARWSPDAVLTLSEELLAPVIEDALERSGSFEHKYELGSGRNFIRPKLAIQTLELSTTDRCVACLAFKTTLSGELQWQIGPNSGSLPMAGELGFDALLGAERRDEDWIVTFLPRDVNHVALEVSGRTFRTVRTIAESAIDEWARNQVFDRIQPIVLTTFQASDLPLRAARVRPEPGALVIELLTQAPMTEHVEPPARQDGESWSLALSEPALLHVARVQAFERGPVAHGVVVEPTGLVLRDGTFDLGVRLWRPVGRGWWRDIAVDGTFTPSRRGFSMEAVEAREVDRSKGARLVDPLAALAEGRILHAVERAVTTTLPGGQEGRVAGADVAVSITRLTGERRTLTAGGTSTITASDSRSGRRIRQ